MTQTQPETRDLVGYCVKCKAQQAMTPTGEPTRMKNGSLGQRGTCTRCGTKMFRIGKKAS